jgi:hypothetical protein
MTKKQIKEEDEKYAIETLKNLVKPGDTIYTILRHVSSSGMSRVIDVVLIQDNKPTNIAYSVSKALDWPIDKNYDGIKVGGCGMDMGFHLVYTLSRKLFKDDMTTDAGYALKQDWI